MERFAIKVDLSAFYNNLYEKVMILADPQWETVAKAEKRIRNLVKIGFEIGFKSQEGFFIPSDESIEILKHVEFVIAFKKQSIDEDNVKASNQSQSVVNPIETVKPIATSEFTSNKKRNRNVLNDVSFTTSTPQQIPHFSKRPKVLKVNDSKLSCNTATTRISKANGGTIKNKTCTEPSEETALNGDQRSSSILADNDNTKPKTASHIHFNENEKENITDVENNNLQQENHNKKEIVFVCKLQDSKKARVFRVGIEKQIPEKKDSNEKSKISILQNTTLVNGNNKSINETQAPESDDNKSINETQTSENDDNTTVKSNDGITSSTNESKMMENSQLDNSSQEHLSESAILCDDSAIIELNDTDCDMVNNSTNITRDSVSISSENVSTINEQQDSARKILLNSSELKQLPEVDDFIVFKLKLINGKTSDFFAGRCDYINKRTKTIRLQLTDGVSQMLDLPAKYTFNIDESIDGLKGVNVKLQEMIDPRIGRG